jgi:hypothetical protein
MFKLKGLNVDFILLENITEDIDNQIFEKLIYFVHQFSLNNLISNKLKLKLLIKRVNKMVIVIYPQKD